MENEKLTERGETHDKAAEPTAQQEEREETMDMNGWDYFYDYGPSNGHNPFGPDDNAYPYGLGNNV